MSVKLNNDLYLLESVKGVHGYTLPAVELIAIDLQKRVFKIYSHALAGGCDSHQGHPVFFQIQQERLIQQLVKNGTWTIIRLEEKVFACNLALVNYIAKEISGTGVEIIFHASVSYSLVAESHPSVERIGQAFEGIKRDYFHVLRRFDAQSDAKILPVIDLEREGLPFLVGLPLCTAVHFNYRSFYIQIYNHVFRKDKLKISFSSERLTQAAAKLIMQCFTASWEAVEDFNAEKKVVRIVYVNTATPDPQLLNKAMKQLKFSMKA